MLEFPFYKADRKRQEKAHEQLPASPRDEETRPQGYLADDGLRDAVNVALLLNQPLLLTGEPGTGKTQLAFSVAYELGFDPPLKFETKSTSTARDLFYVYDALGRYHKDSETTSALSYITFNTLGKAILRTWDPKKAAKYLHGDELHKEACRSVVLIDEIDKAPRDFPNDVLGEIEGMYFRIPELSNEKIEAEGKRTPVLIITSNSEKHLPDAFLRRCTYYHIPFPDEDRLKEIVTERLGDAIELDNGFLEESLKLFDELRKPSGQIRKKPSTAELLGWLVALRRMAPKGDANPLQTLEEKQVVSTIATLIKGPEDRETAESIVNKWLKKQRDSKDAAANG